jgi:protein TonB
LRAVVGERGSASVAIGLPRPRLAPLAIATAAVVSLHAALLLVRPDGFAPGRVFGARVLAVRLLPPRTADLAMAPSPPVQAIPEPHRDKAPPDAVSEAANARKPPASTQAERSAPAPHRAASVADRAPGDPAPAMASAALPAAPDYLSGPGLDPGPRPLGEIEPEYPESAHLQEGMVVLRILISETGKVDDVAVVRAEPKGVFDAAALEAFRAAHFSPGMLLGVPVKSQITVQVDFVPINRGARISGRMY